jgi:hypothetical protein
MADTERDNDKSLRRRRNLNRLLVSLAIPGGYVIGGH